MTFGETIQQLLLINNIKMGNLAKILDYDISYISKWINEAKLPSHKSAESICDRVASYIVCQSSPGGRMETAAKLKITAPDSASFEKALSDRLYTIYLEQKAQPTPAASTDNNALMVLEPSSIAEKTINEVISIYRTSKALQLEGILAMPPDFLASDNIFVANRICGLENSKKILHLRQLIDFRDFSQDIDQYMRYIIKHLSLHAPILVDFFAPSSEGFIPSENPTLILKHGVVIQGIRDAITGGQHFSIVTHDPAIVSEYYRITNAYMQTQTPLMERLNRDRILHMNLPYSYALQRANRYIMHVMVPVHLSPALLDEFLDKYLDAPEQHDYQRKMHEVTYDSFNSLLTYKSTLVDYMNGGNIRLFDGIVTLTRDDRKRHLMHLVEEMEAQKYVSLKILNDRNPLLDYNDTQLTIYMNENVTFAVHSKQNAIDEIINFISPYLCQALSDFYSHLDALPESYLKTGKRAIDYIYNGIKMI